MRKKFHTKTLVLRKKHLTVIIFIAVSLICTKNLKIPSSFINKNIMFSSALLCLGENKPFFATGYKNILKNGNIVFAYTPSSLPKPEKNISPPKTEEPEKEILPVTTVQEKHISIPSKGIEMRNQTSFSPDTKTMLNSSLDYLPVDIYSDNPQVLIFHTHTTESFYGCDRTDDEQLNVVAIGKIISDYLIENGINTIHCKTVHDYDYNGSYSKSYATVEKILSENPSIKVVLDVHRDGITYDDGSGLRVVSDINGKTVGQFMLVVGTDEGGLYHPAWKNNLSFALKLQNHMNEKFPGFARPLNLRQERFNQNLSPGMIIVECGANSNSLDEVKLGAELFSEVLFEVITQ